MQNSLTSQNANTEQNQITIEKMFHKFISVQQHFNVRRKEHGETTMKKQITKKR